MSTLAQITYNIASAIDKQNDDVFIKRLEFMVQYYRSLLMKRDIDSGRKIPQQFIQSLGCLDTIEVDAAECCSVQVNCTVRRTKDKIPSALRLRSGNYFQYVGTIDGMKSFDHAEDGEIPYYKYSKYVKNKAFYVYKNEYIYIFNSEAEAINVKGIFENPEDVSAFNNCGGEDCFDENSQYPVSLDLVQQITQSIMSNELRIERPENDNNEINVNE